MVLSMDRWRGKVAVVTGAGGGIGTAVVEKLLEENLQVVGIDNSSESLYKLSEKFQTKTTLLTRPADVTDPEEVAKLFTWITEKIGPVHVLINCAGVVQQTSLIGGDPDKWKRVLDTNVLGLCIVTGRAMKIMQDNGIEGHVVHVGSAVTHNAPDVPFINVYPASKYAVKALTETYRQEINRLGLKIKVSCITPGKVKTLIATNNDFQFTEELEEMPDLAPGDVADCVVYMLSTPPHVQVHELLVKPVGETV